MSEPIRDDAEFAEVVARVNADLDELERSVHGRANDLLDLLRERAYRAIDNDPYVLLAGPCAGTGVRADAVFARLLGFDDQVVADWRIPVEQPYLLRAIPRRLSLERPANPTLGIRAARYALWSGHVVTKIDRIYADQLGIPARSFQATLLFLRYKRDS